MLNGLGAAPTGVVLGADLPLLQLNRTVAAHATKVQYNVIKAGRILGVDMDSTHQRRFATERVTL